MAKWNEIESSPAYAALPDERKASVKARYFDTVIAPAAPPERVAVLRSKFLGTTAPVHQPVAPTQSPGRPVDRSIATLGATQQSQQFERMSRDDGTGTVADPFRPSGLFRRSHADVFDEAPSGSWVRMEDGSLQKRETSIGEAVTNIPSRIIGVGASAIKGIGDLVTDYTKARDESYAKVLRDTGRSEESVQNVERQTAAQRETGLNSAFMSLADQLHDASKERMEQRSPNTTIQDVYDDPLKNTLPFIGETSLHSAGDMMLAMNPATLPVLTAGLSNEIAETRMENDGRSGRPSGSDRVIGAVGGVAQSGLESFGMGRLLKPVSEGAQNLVAPVLRVLGETFGESAKRVAKETGVQAGQETAEEGIGYLTETVGTKRGASLTDFRDAVVSGALAGGGLGAVIQAGKEAINAMSSGNTPPPAGASTPSVPPSTPAPTQAAPMIQPVAAPTAPPPIQQGEDLLNGGTVADQMVASTQSISPSPAPDAQPISAAEAQEAAIVRGAELEAKEVDGNITADELTELDALRQNIDNVGMLAAMMGRTLEADQDVAPDPATPAAVPQTGLTNAIQSASAPDSLVPSGSTAKPVDQDVTMQNRARDRAASVVQMHGIANNPDPARLSYSRDPGTGAPMVYIGGDSSPEIADSDFGRSDTVTMANGRKVPVRYAVVEADQIQASHTVDGASNPDYSQPLQAGGVRALNNGRTAGLQSAFARGSAGGYVEGIIADGALHGVSAEAIRSKRKPVLVRVYPEAENTGDMGAESNASQALGLSASEQAATDARALPDMETLSVGEDGDLLAAGNRPFIRSWLQAMGQNEASRMLSADGEPTKQMIDRLKAAIFHRAYGADRLTSAMAEDASPEMRNILAALTMAAPRFARIDRAGAFGDVAAQIADAIELIRDSKARGIAIGSVRDMFSERASVVDELAKRINDKARAPRKLGELLNELARFFLAEQSAAQTVDIFGRAPLTYDDAIKAWDQFDEQQNPDAARARAKPAEPETASGAVDPSVPVGDSGPNRSEAGREGQPAEQAKEPGLIPALMLSAQQAPVVEAPRAAAAQTSLFAPPTRAEVIKGAERKKDAERNGENSTGRTDMMAGDGELFAGPRPEQLDVEREAQARGRRTVGRGEGQIDPGDLADNAVVEDSDGNLYWVRSARHHRVSATPITPGQRAPSSADVAVRFNLRPDDTLGEGERAGPLFTRGQILDLGTFLPTGGTPQADVEQEANKVSERRKPWEVSSSEWMTAERAAINAARASDDAEIPRLRARVDYNRQQLRGKMPKADRARLEQIVADDESRILQLSARPLDSDAADITQSRHRRIVESAIGRGESIPAEVLAEYPDLAESEQAGKVEAAAAEAATSPTNDKPEPTDAQKKAGNYAKGHITLHGLGISIENPAGTRRRSEWPALAHHYGYFKGTEGKDGDHVDVFLGPDAENAELPVFVVDQVNKSGRFDEHKVMLGFADETSARAGYLANYTPGWNGLGGITEMSLPDFKSWVSDPARTTKRASADRAKSESEFKPMAQRIANAEQSFIDSVGEQFGIPEHEAAAALKYFTAKKLIKIDPIGGRFNMNDGRFWDADAIRKAAGLQGYKAKGQATLPAKETAAQPVKADSVLDLPTPKLEKRLADLDRKRADLNTKHMQKYRDGSATRAQTTTHNARTADLNEQIKEIKDELKKRAKSTAKPDATGDAVDAGSGAAAKPSASGYEAAKAVRDAAESQPITEAEARKRLEWRDMGQRDNTKRLQLSFQDADGRPMTYGTLTKDTGAKAWTVADSDGWRHSLLTAAKKKAEDLAIERLRKDGYVTKDREVVDTSKDKRIGTDINGKPVFEGSDGSLKGIPYTFDERGKVRTGVAMQEQDQQAATGGSNDRDTFTLERLNRETNKMEPVTFKRGEYIRYRIGDKDHFGEIDGISQARREFSVDGLWYPMGFAYKAERPAAPARKDMTTLSKVIDKVNAKNGEGLTDADRVPEQKPASKTPNVDAQEAAISALNDGTLTVDQYRAAFESALSSEQAIKEELSGKTKDALLGMLSPMLQSRYRGDKKAAVVDVVYSEMVGSYALRGLSYVLGGKGSREAAIRKSVESETAETLAAYAEKLKSARAARAEETAAREESIADPKTLEDFRLFIRNARLQEKTYQESYLMLTPEQRARYDALEAESTREAREERQRKAKTEVRAAGQATDGQIIEAMHTRDNYPLFVVQLSDRLSADDYRTVLAGAKKLGGWYSKFRGNGAVPGFQFKDRESAEAFVKLAGGDTSAVESAAEQRRDAFDDDRSQSAVERLREMADRLDESADSVLNASRKTNTARRAAFAASALNSAEADKALAKTMRNIASAIESGTAKFLSMVRTKTQVELLRGTVRAAKDNELRAKYSSYADQEKHKGQPATDETAGFAEFPAYTAFRSDLASLARQMLEVDGLKKLGQQLMTVADDVTDAYIEFAKQPANLYRVSSFAMRRGDDVSAAVFKSKDDAEKAIKRSGLVGKAIVLPVKRGDNRVVMSPSEAINQGIWTGDGDKRITLTPAGGEILVEAIGRRGNKTNNLTVPWQFQNAYDRRKALSRMGIETPAEFRSALREFIGMQAQATTNKVREMELAMVGRKNDGLDFFPTPEHVADQMIEAAEIQAGMRVLEPSAGMGHIADRIREAGSEPDVIEMAGERRELLQEKGYSLVASDFTEFTSPTERGFTFGDLMRAPDGTVGILRGQGGMGSDRVRLVSDEAEPRELGKFNFSELEGVERRGVDSGYDRIVMNPPFSNRRDAEHVRHAYSLLKPGGRIVAIMGEGVFFGQDKKAQDFREWLEDVGGTSEKLPPGSFMDPSLPVNTGVSARMVVIDKAASDVMLSRPATDTINVDGIERPRTNSNGKPIHDTDEGLRNFWRWFGDSKAVDAQGKPLVVYHGTTADFEAFDLSRAKSEGGAIFLSNSWPHRSPDANAKTYAGQGGRVIGAYVKMENPRIVGPDVQVTEQSTKEEIDELLSAVETFNRSLDWSKEKWLAKEIATSRRNGNDGVIVRHIEDDRTDYGRMDPTNLYIAFRPEQIKSATGNNGNFSPDDARITHSRATDPVVLSGESAKRSALRDVLDGWNGDVPVVKLLESHEDIPLQYRDLDGHWKTAEGFFADGKVFVVLGSNRDATRAVEVLRHEAVGHYGVEQVLGGEWDGLVKGIADVRTGRKGALSSAEWKAVIRDTAIRYPDFASGDKIAFSKEVLAVAAERGITGGIMDRIIAKVRQFLRRLGLIDGSYSEAEARDVLRRALKTVTNGSQDASTEYVQSPQMSTPDRAEAAGRVAQVFLALAESDPDSLMRYAKSTATDLPAVVSDILGRDVKVTRKGAIRQNFEQKVPGAIAILVPAEKWTIRSGDGKPFDVYVEGEHANVPMTGRRLFIDAAFAESGKSMGSGIYAALFQYALNNGMVFTGDPAGLSDAALLRRTEHMLSAAIKHGTTRMMHPHPRQMDPADRNHGLIHTWVAPLKWTIGDDAANIAAMLDTSTRNTMGLLRGTDANGYVYSLSDGRLLDARGEVVSKQRLVDLASQATATLETRVKAAGGLATEAIIGSTTIARAISAQSLIRQVQGRSSLLADVAERLSRASVESDPLYRAFYSASAPTFYSAMLQAVEAGKGAPKRADATAWMQWLDGAARRGEIKADERYWLGLDEWLDSQQGQITREALADFVRANGVQVTETVLGERLNQEASIANNELWEYAKAEDLAGRRSRLTDAVLDGASIDEIERVSQTDTPDAMHLAMAYVNAARRQMPSKYGEYTLPGGTNYREVLLTLPDSRKASEGWKFTQVKNLGPIQSWDRGNEEKWAAIAPNGDRTATFDTEAAARSYAAKHGQPDKRYKSSHWDQPNVLAHIRVNDRVDADGKRVLFVEEIQSDWGQEGKRTGFEANGQPVFVESERARDARAELEESERVLRNVLEQTDDFGGVWDHADEVIEALGNDPSSVMDALSHPEARAAARQYAASESALMEIPLQERSPQGTPKKKGTPAAPFVTATDKWLTLALKRVLRMAVDGGYDKVAFVTGEQSAGRFSLDKHLSLIEFAKAGPDNYRVKAYDINDGVVSNMPREMSAKQLEDHLGKEIAERIVKAERGSLDGEGLKVEAHGMRAFYDKIVPAAVKDLLKKVGGGQMESVEIAQGNDYVDKSARSTQTGFTINAAMRQKVSAGLPLFSRSQPQVIPPVQPASPGVPTQGTMPQAVAARGKIADLTSPESFDRLIYEFQDKFIDLRRVQDRITELGGAINDINDAYLGEELFHARLAKRTQNFLRDELKPLLASLKAAGIPIAEFETFLHARHAPEANAVLADRNPNQATIDQARATALAAVKSLELQLQTAQVQGTSVKAINDALDTAREDLARWNRAQAFRGTEAERLSLSGMTDADAAAHMAAIDPGKRITLDALAAKIDAMQSKTLDTLVSYGLMDKASIDAWRQTYQYYIPLHRDEAHPDSVAHPTGSGFNVRGDASRGRTGSNEKVTHILSHIAMQREAALTRGEKNHVVKKLYLMATQNKDPDFWTVDTPLTSKIVDPSTGFVRQQVDPLFKSRPHVVMLRIAGKDRAIVFNEHNKRAVRLAHSLKNLDVDDLHYVLGAAAKATRWFASVNTQYNPVFGFLNLWRDAQSAVLNLSSTALRGKQAAVMARILPAMRAIYRERRGKAAVDPRFSRLWEEMQIEGGVTGYRDLFRDAGERAKAIDSELRSMDRGKVSKAAHAIVDWLDHYNTALENAVRLAAYDVALSQGMSKPRAASVAKNLTVNFNRKGRQTREVGALYAFFNASVQGNARTLQTLTGPAGKAIVAGGIGIGFVASMLAAAFMGEDDYEKIPDFVRERSLVIPIGGGKYFSWPYPLGFHVLPNLGRIAAEMMMGVKKPIDGYVDTMMIAADTFSPLGSASGGPAQMLSPTALDPAVALMQNSDWTGMPIYKEDFNSLDPTPGHTRAKDSASLPAKVLSQFANWATGGNDYKPGRMSPTPDQIDFITGQVTGGLGREILKAMQVLQAPFSDDELPLHKVPLVGRVIGSTSGQSGEAGRFYAAIRELNVLGSELDGRIKSGDDPQDFMLENPKANLIEFGKASYNQVKKLRKLRDQLSDAGAERDAINAVNDQITETMAELNKAMSEAD